MDILVVDFYSMELLVADLNVRDLEGRIVCIYNQMGLGYVWKLMIIVFIIILLVFLTI